MDHFSSNILRNIALLILVIVVVQGSALLASPTKWPSTVSELNGWNGFKLTRGARCPVCYSLIIPTTFGLENEQELRIIINLPKKRIGMNYDLDGPLFDDEDVLDHLLHLALDYKYTPAARVILSPTEYDMAIGIETSERIIGTHFIPLILGYKDLNVLITKTEYKRIAKLICHWSAGERNFKISDSLANNLKSRQFDQFSTTLSATCSTEKKLMEKYGERFVDGDNKTKRVRLD